MLLDKHAVPLTPSLGAMPGEDVMSYRCPLCGYEFDTAVAAQIAIIDGDCPSSCDDGAVIRVRCPQCGRIAWAKTIAQEYATWRDWPAWVGIVPLYQAQVEYESYDEYLLEPQGDGTVVLRQRNEDGSWMPMVILTRDEDGDLMPRPTPRPADSPSGCR